MTAKRITVTKALRVSPATHAAVTTAAKKAGRTAGHLADELLTGALAAGHGRKTERRARATGRDEPSPARAAGSKKKSDCPHPIGRRIDGVCMECMEKV